MVNQHVKGTGSEALRLRAHTAHLHGQLDFAEQLYRRLLEVDFQAGDAANLGAMLRHQGRLQDALSVYRAVINEGINDINLFSNAANAFREAEDYESSEHLLRRGLTLNPGNCILIQGLAKTLLAQNKAEEALNLLNTLFHLVNPSHELWFDLGVAHSRLGRNKEALNCFDEATIFNSSHVPTVANRITLLNDLGQVEKARDVLNSAVLNDLVGVEIDAATSVLLMSEQDMVSASTLLLHLCEKQPLVSAHWLNLAAAFRSLKYIHLPARILKQGLVYCPSNLELLHALLQAISDIGQLREAQTVLELLDLNDAIYSDNHFFSLQFLSTSFGLLCPAKRRELALSWESYKKDKAEGMNCLYRDYLPEPMPGRRMRIGYLSSDFCNHPVSRFLLPILQSHDSQFVEVWGFHAGPNWDGVSEDVKQVCDHWLDLNGCSDLQAARMISEQRLDVLVELGGYTGFSRLSVCLYGVAPLQVSYLGYSGATFLRSVPFWLGDATLFKNLSDADREHRLLEVEGGYMCFPIPSNAPEVDRLGSRYFRFASFNNARKITDSTIQLWSQLLSELPHAELVCKSISFRNDQEIEFFRLRFERAGISRSQLIVFPVSDSFHEHLECYNRVDVALDPIPYGGATTTAEALWMGVPVVCMHGSGMVGALSASLLNSASQAQWISYNDEEYINHAKALMHLGIRNRNQRLELRAQISNSDLNKPRRVSRQIEKLFMRELIKKFT